MSEYITIPLSKTGKHAGKYEVIVSIEDADLADLNWNVMLSDNTHYAQRRTTRKSIILMHRAVLERKIGRPLKKGEIPDHINSDGWDNRRENLRIATHSQNMANMKNQKNKSGYRGVYFHELSGLWRAEFSFEKKRYYIGYFKTREEAYEARNEKARELHKEYGKYE